MIRSEGQKMAKSVGNIFLLREVLDRYADAAHGDAPVVLMYFLTTHYRSPLEFSTDKLDEAKAQYERLAGFVRDVDFRTARAGSAGEAGEAPALRARIDEARRRFAEHMDDDLNTAGALGELFSLAGEVYRYMSSVDAGEAPLDAAALRTARAEVAEMAGILLIRLPEPEETDDEAAEDAAACATGELAPCRPARKLAAEGRWDDVEFLYRERLAVQRPDLRRGAARPLPRREGLGQVRPAARRAAGGRFRGARHQARHPGGAARLSGRGPGEGRAAATAMDGEWIYGRQVVRLALAAGARRRPAAAGRHRCRPGRPGSWGAARRARARESSTPASWSG